VGTLKYQVVDVFTDQPYAGNPLAVVLDADGLSADRMQLIAREFNLSETAFVLTPSAGVDYRVRIFTPTKELPFAGHPSVGTAVTLARLGRIRLGEVYQECGIGLLPVIVTETTATLAGGPPSVGPELDPAPLLAALGLTRADHAGPAPRVAGCGVDFPYIPVRPESLEKITVNATALSRQGYGQVAVVAWDPEQREAQMRMFAPGMGIAEDPATGAAALGLGVWLVASGLASSEGTTSYRVRQGAAIGRPSLLECTVTAKEGRVVRTTVTGSVAPVASGELIVP